MTFLQVYYSFFEMLIEGTLHAVTVFFISNISIGALWSLSLHRNLPNRASSLHPLELAHVASHDVFTR